MTSLHHTTPTPSAAARVKELKPGTQRGRRRRRSSTKAGGAQSTTSTSPSAQWWERGLSPGEAYQGSTLAEEENDEGSESCSSSWSGGSSSGPSAASLSRLRIHTHTDPGHDDKAPHTADTTHGSVRSPAADFLSAFSSLHSVVASPIAAAAATEQPGSWAQRNTRSLSPAATTSHLLHAYGTAAPSRLPASASAVASMLDSSTATQPLTGAAVALLTSGSSAGASSSLEARLPSTTLPPLPARALAPDDEGATLAEGRYVLGRAIGFGGSSTVREAWDRASSSAAVEQSQADLRKVVVKIVRLDAEEGGGASVARGAGVRSRELAVLDDEVGLWSSLPEHTHLLPLLHHEVVPLQHTGGGVAPSNGTAGAGRIIFLVMPFADAGSLLDFVRNEGTIAASLAKSSTSSLARSTSLHAALAPQVAIAQGGSLRAPRSSTLAFGGIGGARDASTRTGSGFLPGRTGRVFSETSTPASSSAAPLSASARPYGNSLSPRISLGASLSAADAAGGSLRRSSSRLGAPQAPRSRGLRMAEAASVTKQICKALQALQKHSVRHGDLKLENVLGQCSRGAAAVRRVEEGAEEVMDFCWRLADFGLATRVGEGEEGKMHMRGARGTREGELGKVPYTGGSLAYAPPEALRTPASPSLAQQGLTSTASPFAADHWALGCIVYALLSGKLPFSDSFEPRLQLKIARGEWSLPARLQLKRRQASPAAAHAKRSEAASEADAGGGASGSALIPPSIAAGMTTSGSIVDLSASMPALPPRQTETNTSDILAGSDLDTDSGDTSADAEELSWSGTRAQRSAARQLLRGLLDTNPSTRWVLEDVLHCKFLACMPSTTQQEEITQIHLAPPTETGDLPASLRNALSPPSLDAAVSKVAVPAMPDEPLRFARQASRERSSSSKRDSSLSRSRPPSDAHAAHRGRGRAPRVASESRSNSGSPAPHAHGSSTRDASFVHSTSDAALNFRLEDLGDTSAHDESNEREEAAPGDWERGRGRAQYRQMADLQEEKTWDASFTSSSATSRRQSQAIAAKQGRSTPIDIAPRDSSGSRSRSRTRIGGCVGAGARLPDSFERAEAGSLGGPSPQLWQGEPTPAQRHQPQRPAMLRSASHELGSRGRSSEPGSHAGTVTYSLSRPTTGTGGGAAGAWRGTSRSTSRPRLAHSNVGLGALHPALSLSGGAEFILPSPSEAFARFPTAVHQTRTEQEDQARAFTSASAVRSSTSRSRSRAPDQLRGLLAREREAASSSASSSSARRGSRDGSPSQDGAATGEVEGEMGEAEQWWQRGRGREVRAARGAAGGSENSVGCVKKSSSRWPWQ